MSATAAARTEDDYEERKRAGFPGYARIEDHGIIGNCQTSALVDTGGQLSFLCFPNFDSPSVFGGLLDCRIGGSWKVDCRGSGGESAVISTKQFYWPETNILVTRFFTDEGVGQVVDYMPMPFMSRHQRPRGVPAESPPRVVVRKLEVVRGCVDFSVLIQPAFDYARQTHRTRVLGELGGGLDHDYDWENGACRVEFESKDLSLAVSSFPPVRFQRKRGHPLGDGVETLVSMTEHSEPTVFVLGQCPESRSSRLSSRSLPKVDDRSAIFADLPALASAEKALFVKTAGFWRKWVSQCTFQGKWREMVIRSCLVLKLLVYSPTGAIIAAATTSLPEGIGGVRQWDYRYTWVRDSSFVVDSFLRVGFHHEAARYMAFIEERLENLDFELSRLSSPSPTKVRKEDTDAAASAPSAVASVEGGAPMPIQIMYSIDGGTDLEEIELDHLEGYKGSKPVRVGNGAAKQVQLDIFGELMDSIYLINKFVEPTSHKLWVCLRKLINWLCENWNRRDEGIWEVRGGQQHFVYSRVMCWVALDRALKLADRRSFPADRTKWTQVRDLIYEEIMHRGWSEERQAFVQSYGGEGAQMLDASNLMMPLVNFIAPTDPQWESTIDAIMQSPSKGGLCENSLIFRYDTTTGHDGLAGHEGTFNICTFWLVSALAKAGLKHPDRLERAELVFEEMLGYANHLGLYAEETGSHGEALGNFPQAFTHLALISAAASISRAKKPQTSAKDHWSA